MLWPNHLPELPWIGVSTEAWGETRLGWGRTFNSTDLAAAYNLLHDHGLRLFDTSELYGHQGQRLAESSEQLLGTLASRRPEPPILSTKFTPVPWTNVLSGGGLRLGRASVLEALRNSLTRLGASSVEIYSVSAPAPFGGRRAFFEGAAEAHRLGLIGGVGACHFNAPRIRQAHAICAQLGLPLLTNQIRFSLFNLEKDLDGTIETCLELGITPVALSPLAGGMATTRYARAAATRAASAGMLGRGGVPIPSGGPPQLQPLEPAFRALSQVAEAAPRRSETQAALQYVAARGCVPLPSVTSEEHAQELADAMGWQISLDELDALHEQALSLHVRRPDVPWLRRL